ncbi:MAG: glycosyltransferase [Parachlamydiaceae bacterium]|nr:glycosyltransferase [Parachlamydiaceae bacterium]
MIKNFLLFFLVFCSVLHGGKSNQSYPDHKVKINLFCADRSGLARDHKILKEVLESLGCSVRHYTEGKKFNFRQAEINIFCETLYPECYSSAELNWFIPNPEWMWDNLYYLNAIDLILCRTHEVDRIFTKQGMKTFYIGFSSPDHYIESIKKDYNSFLHLAGTSSQKGTYPIIKAWKQNPKFPHLTTVRFADPEVSVPINVTWITDWMPESQLRALQNKCGIHLCVSETEGYGHSLVEAMATKAIVITTNAPPMNEFITDPRCLVTSKIRSSQGLATNYHVDGKAIEKTIKKILKLSPEELEEIGCKNRERYLQYRPEFISRLKKLLQASGKNS